MNPRHAAALTDQFGIAPVEILCWLLPILGLPILMIGPERQSIKTLGVVLTLGGFLIVILFLMHRFAFLGYPHN